MHELEDPTGGMPVDLFFLTDSYKHTYFYWEALEAARKLVLIGFLLFFKQGTLDQVMVGLLVCLLSTMIYVNCKPFRTKADNSMALLCEASSSRTDSASLQCSRERASHHPRREQTLPRSLPNFSPPSFP